MTILVISCSLNPVSRSRAMAEQAIAQFASSEAAQVELLDLRELQLPMCDGCATDDANVRLIRDRIRAADAVVLAVPIYNFDVNAAAKNLIELTGKTWTDKIVGFLCAAGGRGSYMSVMALANSLMLDFRCLVIPRFVFSTNNDFEDDVPGPVIRSRIADLCDEAVRLADALRPSVRTP